MRNVLIAVLGLWHLVCLSVRERTGGRTERGLSQSAENAILLAGAVTVAGIVIAAVTVYVRAHLPR
ncbi:MAG: hypothetical protein ACTH2Q_08110 [Propionibacteriaceae bacterium]